MNFGLSHLCFDKLKMVMQEEHRLFCGDESFFDFLFPTQCNDIEQHANKWGGNVNCQLIFSWFISWWNRMNNNETWWNMMKPVCFISGVTILVAADHNLLTQALQHLDMCYNQIYDRGRKRRYGRNSTVWTGKSWDFGGFRWRCRFSFWLITINRWSARGNHLENWWKWFPLCRKKRQLWCSADSILIHPGIERSVFPEIHDIPH